LQPGTRYAAMIFNGLHDTAGNRLAPSPALEALDGPAPSGVSPAVGATLAADRNDVTQAVRSRTLLHPSWVVAFTTFTTQDATSEMAAIASAVADLPTPEVLRSTLTSPCIVSSPSRTTARLALPIWQSGNRPHLDAGGSIEVGADGKAVQHG